MSDEVEAWDRALRAILARDENAHGAMRDLVEEAMADRTGAHMLVHCLSTIALHGVKRQFGENWEEQITFERLKLRLGEEESGLAAGA